MNVKKLKFDYSWIIIGVCFIMVGLSLGLCSSGRSLYLTAITEALHIPRSAFSINDTIRFITSTVVNIFFGRLVGRFGTKKLIVAGFLCLISFAIINSVATNLIWFYIGGVFLGIGLSWTSTTMVSTIINRWCTSNKGTITGVTLAANGIGGAIAVQVLSPIIFQEGNPFGYRISYRLVSAILAVGLLIVLIFYREKTNSKNSNFDTVKKRKARGAGWIGMDYSKVVKKPYFYVSIFSIFCTGMALQGLGGITVPHMYDVGINIELVALVTSISSILLTVSKFSVGYMYDRLGMRLCMNICYVCAFVSLFCLIAVTNTPLGETIAFGRTFFSAVALPLETVMLPLFASEFFGNRDFDKVVGVFVSANYAGYALGSPLGNACHDLFGDYKIAFLIFGILMIITTVAMQYSLLAARHDRKLIESNPENITTY